MQEGPQNWYLHRSMELTYKGGHGKEQLQAFEKGRNKEKGVGLHVIVL